MKTYIFVLSILFSSLLIAQTPNVNIPHTPRFQFNMYRAHVDTVKAGDTTSKAPTGVGLNSNFLKIDSILNVQGKHDSLIQLSYTNASTGGWYGNKTDGNIGIVADSSLTRDMQANILRIDGLVHLRSSGYRIFADSVFIASTATITDTGQNGNDGTAGGNGVCPSTAGSGGGQAGNGLTNSKGDAYLARDTPTSTTINGQGSVGTQSGNTTAGTAGISQTLLVGSAGVAGGTGGSTSGHTAGSGGAAGATTALPASNGSVFNFLNLFLNRAFTPTPGITLFRWAGFSGGGSGGCGDNGAGSAYGQGGGGGSAAAPGGIVWISARVISGSGTISAKGGKGGNGGKGGDYPGGCTASCGAGGGGGGGGGTGGAICAFYHELSSSITFVVTGGNGGTGGVVGSGSCTPTAGANGSNGNTGILFKISD